MRRLAPLALFAFAAPAAADYRINDAGLQFYAPQADWALRLPRDDWQVLQERRGRGEGAYYFVASPSKELQFSVFLDKTADCNSGPACRDLWKRNSGKAFEAALEPIDRDRNGFSVVQFHLDRPAGAPVVQTNVSAHLHRDGYWIDVRITKVGETRPDPEVLLAALDTMSLRAKSLGGPRQYAAGRGRYLAMDVPAGWRDALGRALGTIELAPAAGDGWKALLTIMPPKQPDAPAPTRQEVLDAAASAANLIRAQSVGDVDPIEFRGRSAWGYRFSATDRAPKPGEYPFLSQGVLALGNVQVLFTILSREGEDASVARALDVISGMRFAK